VFRVAKRRTVSPQSKGRRQELLPAAILTVLIVLTVALRFWRLGDWGFDSDETFTLRDSVSLDPNNPRPLLYLLNHYLVHPLVPLDELGLRLLPAVFGVLAVPAFYHVVQRLVGTRAALFGALLLAFSGLHVYYSQFARYWSLVFLLSAVYPYAIYLGIRERNRQALLFGLATAVVAVLAHPASVLPMGGLGLWMLATYLKRGQLAHAWSQKSVRWAALLLVFLTGVIALRCLPMLQAWISEHDSNPGGTEFILSIPGRQGIRQMAYLLGFVESLTVPLVLIGVLGIYLLCRGRDRSLGFLLALMFVLPLAFLVLLSFRTPVSTFYLVPTLPILFIGAGVFLDRLTDVKWELRPRWLLSATVAAITIAAGAPTLISQYRDGRRYDFRGAAHWLDERLGPQDIIFSDQAHVLSHYLPKTPVHRLQADIAPLTESVHVLYRAGRGGTVWVVAPAPSHAFRTNPKLGNLSGWLYENCRLRNTIGVSRVDFRQNLLQVYACAPADAEGVIHPGGSPISPGAKADKSSGRPAGL
jgi:uncharacterized membrane protein